MRSFARSDADPEDRSRKLSAAVGTAGMSASGTTEAKDHLEKSYTPASDVGESRIIDECSQMRRGSPSLASTASASGSSVTKPSLGCTERLQGRGATRVAACAVIPNDRGVIVRATGSVEFNCREQTACQDEARVKPSDVALDTRLVVNGVQYVVATKVERVSTFRSALVFETTLPPASGAGTRNITVELRPNAPACGLDHKNGCIDHDFEVTLAAQ